MLFCNMQNPQVGVGVIVLKDNKVLLGKRKGKHGSGTWQLPGGRLEFGETPEECALRELKEETGLIGKNPKKGTWVNSFFEKESIHFISLFFIVHEFEGTPENKEPHACESWEWFERGHLPEPLFPPLKSLMKEEAPQGNV